MTVHACNPSTGKAMEGDGLGVQAILSYNKPKRKKKRGGAVAQLVKYLPSMHEALGLILSTA